ncbi:hypothetical protein [Mangrovihabitans endophyticus]|uniref:Uncharacterized protein n=1 Tax=Mangrovihabitans endophyticus TaxID=1751298 RepID=A0A8J3BW65_9ACTN|nr:hypothetical protein [Mangrovihabitans endophyticus]GGK79212.1 hypothetical protein GCM10012284_11520 [Mangrovihabitans endophyticus]
MPEPEESADQPDDEKPETESEPARPAAADETEAPGPAGQGEAAGPEPPAEEPKELEDVDPEPNPEDDSAAQDDRVRAFHRISSIQTGDGSRSYLAEQQNFFGGEFSPLPRHGAVPGAILGRLGRSYVASPALRRLLQALPVSPLQCLFGPPGTGRTTTAIAAGMRHLKDRGLAVAGNVHILASERGLAAIDSKSLPKRKALILTLAPDAAPPEFRWFGAVEEALRERDSILIVVSPAEPVGGALRDGWTVAYQPPAPEEIFRRHLEQRFGAGRIAEILDLGIVRDRVRTCRTPRDAAGLATAIINDTDDGVADADLLSGDSDDKLVNARKELQESDLWDRILLVATTVMTDLAAGTVTREAVRLAEMHKPTGVQTEVPKVDWFHGPDRWPGSITLGPPGKEGSGRTVRLVHPRLPIMLLKAIWEDHVGERDILLPWLCGLGDHPHKRVRVKAAQAAAQLACYDFDVVMREVLRVWALDGRFRTRETCALALEALAIAAEGRFAKRVRGQVRGWAKSNNPSLLAAAVAVYGTFLGAKDPDEALTRMREVAGARIFRYDGRREMAEHAEQQLANIVRRALIDVFNAGAEEKVLQALAGWARIPNWRWRRAAAAGLIELSRKDGSGAWPLLVELSAVQESTYRAVRTLWLNTLDSHHRDEASWEALHRWLDQARDLRGDDSTAAVVAAVDRLVADLRAESPDIGRHLDFHQEIWAFRDARRQPEVFTKPPDQEKP